MHKETVEEPTLELIKKLQSSEALKDFVLVGGTALALHLGHRKSIDIDLFSRNPFDAQKMSETLEAEFEFKQEYIDKNTLKGHIGGVKIDIITHPYPDIDQTVEENGIRLASINDIAAMKVNAICVSGERVKDFIDIHELLKTKKMSDILECYSKKYSQRSITHAAKSIVYFDDVDTTDWPVLIKEKKLTWKSVRENISSSMQEHNKAITNKQSAALYQAIAKNDAESVKAIMNKGVEPNFTHVRLVNELKQKGGDIDPVIEKMITRKNPDKGFGK
ncbi:MAG: nucleotidyl transferase AbiEii/AbiGii toxin family protein [Breznakibacter sp.]